MKLSLDVGNVLFFSYVGSVRLGMNRIRLVLNLLFLVMILSCLKCSGLWLRWVLMFSVCMCASIFVIVIGLSCCLGCCVGLKNISLK